MPADTAHHAIRDGDYPIIYIAGSRGLYKLFYQSGQIELMRACAADEQGHMVGYAGLVNPATGFELVILPNFASGAADRIWHYQATSGGWIERTPPIAGRRWRGIAVARSNPLRWVIWGDSNPSGLNGADSITSRAGLAVGVGDYQPAFWQTTDGGQSWSAYPVPTGIDVVNDTSSFKDALLRGVQAFFTTDGDQLAIGAVTRGQQEDQFNRPLNTIAIWRDGVNIWSSTARLAALSLTGFGPGQNDDILAAGIFNAGGGGVSEYKFGYVPTGATAWQQVGSDYDNGDPIDYAGDYALNFAVEPGSRRAAAIQAHPLGPQTGALFTTDYRSAMFTPNTPASARLSNTDPSGITFSRAGIYTTGAHDLSTGAGTFNYGMLHTSPETAISTELYMSYSRLAGITTARQRSQTATAARLDGSSNSTTDPALFAVFTGDSWTQIPGPPATPGANIADHFAVIER